MISNFKLTKFMIYRMIWHKTKQRETMENVIENLSKNSVFVFRSFIDEWMHRTGFIFTCVNVRNLACSNTAQVAATIHRYMFSCKEMWYQNLNKKKTTKSSPLKKQNYGKVSILCRDNMKYNTDATHCNH